MIKTNYWLCVENHGYPASLELRKVYRQVADAAAGPLSLLRIVDESGEDYLYPQKYFVPIEVPARGRRVFSRPANHKPTRLARSRR